MKTYQIIGVTLCSLSLTACQHFYEQSTSHAPKYQVPKDHHAAAIQLYPDGYDNGGAYAPDPKSVADQKPLIPEQTTSAAKPHDTSWVGKQNPQGYTIEIVNGDNAHDVSTALQKTPKNEPTAQVKYHQDGKAYYKGIYGSYPTYEAAQKALNSLPDDLKQKARVKTWGNVQSVNQP